MRLRESCSTPHHPMRVSLPAAPFTAAGMSKINVPRIAFLETSRIIALPPPKSNRKAKLPLTARLSQMRTFFTHTSLQIVFTSCPCCFQIIMQEKHGYTHGNPLRTSHIAICEVKSNKQKPIPHNRSTNPNESDTTHLTLSQFKA